MTLTHSAERRRLSLRSRRGSIFDRWTIQVDWLLGELIFSGILAHTKAALLRFRDFRVRIGREHNGGSRAQVHIVKEVPYTP